MLIYKNTKTSANYGGEGTKYTVEPEARYALNDIVLDRRGKRLTSEAYTSTITAPLKPAFCSRFIPFMNIHIGKLPHCCIASFMNYPISGPPIRFIGESPPFRKYRNWKTTTAALLFDHH